MKKMRSLTSNSTLNSYFSRLCMHQQVPNHFVPSLLDSNRNQSVPESLLFWTYWKAKKKWKFIEHWKLVNYRLRSTRFKFLFFSHTLISAWYSSFSRCTQSSFSRGPAFVCNNGMPLNVLRVLASTIFAHFKINLRQQKRTGIDFYKQKN